MLVLLTTDQLQRAYKQVMSAWHTTRGLRYLEKFAKVAELFQTIRELFDFLVNLPDVPDHIYKIQQELKNSTSSEGQKLQNLRVSHYTNISLYLFSICLRFYRA